MRLSFFIAKVQAEKVLRMLRFRKRDGNALHFGVAQVTNFIRYGDGLGTARRRQLVKTVVAPCCCGSTSAGRSCRWRLRLQQCPHHGLLSGSAPGGAPSTVAETWVPGSEPLLKAVEDLVEHNGVGGRAFGRDLRPWGRRLGEGLAECLGVIRRPCW